MYKQTHTDITDDNIALDSLCNDIISLQTKYDMSINPKSKSLFTNYTTPKFGNYYSLVKNLVKLLNILRTDQYNNYNIVKSLIQIYDNTLKSVSDSIYI